MAGSQTSLSQKKRYRVSFDVGGTFTDFTLLSEDEGSIQYHKVASTPADPAQAIATGVAEMMREYGIAPDELVHVGHGTTVATNMVIERRGARIAVITTRGFRDVLEIGRQTRPNLYDYNVLKPTPLASRELRLEVDERIAHDGTVLRPLDEDQVHALAEHLASQDIEAIAVCLMHSYRNPVHEQRVCELLRERLPNVYLSASCDILPEFREFERMSTTALNAYIGPRMASYMGTLVRSLQDTKVPAQPATIHSNGGLMSVESVLTAPVRTCVSGPAAGVIGTVELGRITGIANLITFDVGGTSTDVSVISDLQPLFTSSRLVADYPVKTQMVDIHVIGAGGGSIARVDDAGALKVGPESAGAVPGPVAYKRGGTIATLTDAHVVLGRLNPTALLAGKMEIDAPAAQRVIQEQVATPLGVSLEEAAYGILRIAISNMARAVRAVSTERGYDVREFALCAFGGAGGLHAGELARECGIGAILVPPEPGTMCARGILLSDISMDFVQTLMLYAAPDTWSEMAAALAGLQARASEWLASEGVGQNERSFNRSIEARYQGQNYEIVLPLDDSNLMSLDEFRAAFSQAHIREYGYDVHGRQIEIVNCRVRAVGRVPRAPLSEITGGESLQGALNGSRSVYYGDTGWLDTPVYWRNRLPLEQDIPGPAVVEEMSSTTVLLPGQTGRVDRYGNLLIRTQS